MKIFVTNLGRYNEGYLVGKWVKLPVSEDKLNEVLKEIGINEYYEEYRYVSNYFICEVTGTGEMRLTDAEKRRGLEPQWIPLEEAVGIFSRHQEYADTSEEKRGSYLRDYTALQEYLASRT